MWNKISVIVPMLNEEENLPTFLEHIKPLQDDAEWIFVDGGSTDRSRSLIPSSCVLLESPKGRAKQMNAGARVSSGDILFFLHADSWPPPEAFKAIFKSVKSFSVGCFKLHFRSTHPLLPIIAMNSNNRVRFRNIAFGDQGIFIKKDLFESMNGFPDTPIMEDYEFSMRLKQKGYRIDLVPLKISTSARRFEQNGPWKTMVKMQIFQYQYRKNKASAYEISKKYNNRRKLI